MSSTITIYNPDGTEWGRALITSSAVHSAQLMDSDYIKLSWDSNRGTEIAIGSYVTWNSITWRLAETYTPTQADDMTWRYEPQFDHPVMLWDYYPFVFTDYKDGAVVQCETDWTYTSYLAEILVLVRQALYYHYKQEYPNCKLNLKTLDDGGTISIKVDADADLAKIKSFSFASVSILSALNTMASTYECEWWYDWEEDDDGPCFITLYFGKCIREGTATILKVGDNVNYPSVTKTDNNQAYTRFYIFGSTRNITQDTTTTSATVSYVVNKRLTLNNTKYPLGCIDIRANLLPGQIHSKVLVFNDVYPRSALIITSVTSELKIYYEDGKPVIIKDSDGNEMTDANGDPIYKTYPIYTVTFATLSQDKTSVTNFLFDDRTYDEDNEEKDFNGFASKGMLIEGKTLTMHFKSGALNGYDFELAYVGDGTYLGNAISQFEIKFTEDSGVLLPSIVRCPYDGTKSDGTQDYSLANEITLYNIKMPSAYIASAQDELEETALKEIADYKRDLNSYEVTSNPIAFNRDNIQLKVGDKVTLSDTFTDDSTEHFTDGRLILSPGGDNPVSSLITSMTNGSETLTADGDAQFDFTNGTLSITYTENSQYGFSLANTRVTAIEENLDFQCCCTITLGESQSKGNTATLKEEVANINENINVMTALSELNVTIQNSYARTQQIITSGLAAWGDMWQLKTIDGQTYIYGKYPLLINGDVVAYSSGVSPSEETDTTDFVADTTLDEDGLLASMEGVTTSRKFDVIGGHTLVWYAGGESRIFVTYLSDDTYLQWEQANSTGSQTLVLSSDISYVRMAMYTNAIDSCYILDKTTETYIWKGKDV